jgi:hypothetical protein
MIPAISNTHTFISQHTVSGTPFNNCWACAINVIKSRSVDDMRAFNRCRTMPGFNNALVGFEIHRLNELFENFSIKPVPIGRGFEIFKDEVTNIASLPRVPIETAQRVANQLNACLHQFGPLLYLRNAAGAEAIHAVSVVNADNRNQNVLLYDSMKDGPTWIPMADFVDELYLVFQAQPLLKIHGVSSFFYDSEFKQNRSCVIL